MEMTETEDKNKLEADVSAEAEGLEAKAKASVSSSASVSVSIQDKEARMKLRVLGGDPNMWLGLTGTNQNDILEKWSKTINSKNEVPIGMTLRPLWELLEKLDNKKAKELKKLMIDEWEKQGANLPDREGTNVRYKYSKKGAMCMGDETKQDWQQLKDLESIRDKASKGKAGALMVWWVGAISWKVEHDKWQEMVALEKKFQDFHRAYMLCASTSHVSAKNTTTCLDWKEEEWDKFKPEKEAFPDRFEEDWSLIKDRCSAEPHCKGFQWRRSPNTGVQGGYLVSAIKGTMKLTETPRDQSDVYQCWEKGL